MPNVDIRVQATGNAEQSLSQTERQLQRMSSTNMTSATTHRRATDIMSEGNRRMAASNQDAEFSFGELDRKIQSLVTGFGAYFVVQKGLELVNLGEQVHDVTVQFEAYAESLDETTALLPRLREATLGGASDMDLMAASAQLASLRLATTDEDLERFIGMTYRLTGSTDQVNNLALALTNMSYLRLDAFGLSADLARKRVEELKDEYEGIADTEAFTRAVIEQMEDKVGEFGDTLDEQVTNLDRFKADFQNFWNDLAVIASEGANEILGYINSFGPQPFTGSVSTDVVVEDVDALREHISLLVEAMDIGGSLTIEEAMAQDKNLRGLTTQGRQILEELVLARQEFIALGAGQPAVTNPLRDAMAVWRDQNARARALTTPGLRQDELQEQLRAGERFADQQREIAYWNERRNSLLQESSTLITGISDEYWNISDASMQIDGVEIVTPDQAERIRSMTEQYDLLVERARVLHENGIIDDAQLEALENAQDRARNMADEMQRGANALETMSRSDFFGTEGGGLMGELSDEVIQAARDRGLTDAQIQELRDAFDVESGRENEASLRWRDEIIPMIVETASGASKTATDDAVAALQQYIMDQGTARFGEEAGAYLAGDDLIPSPDVYEPFQTATLEIGENFKSAGDGTTVMQEQLTVADLIAANLADSSGRVETHFRNVTSAVQRINVEINVQRITGGAFETWIAENVSHVVRANGGTTPGADARTQRTGGR